LGRNGAGENDTVEEVYVKDCSFNATQNGARIETFQVNETKSTPKL
jgi:polygalacturonase